MSWTLITCLSTSSHATVFLKARLGKTLPTIISLISRWDGFDDAKGRIDYLRYFLCTANPSLEASSLIAFFRQLSLWQAERTCSTNGYDQKLLRIITLAKLIPSSSNVLPTKQTINILSSDFSFTNGRHLQGIFQVFSFDMLLIVAATDNTMWIQKKWGVNLYFVIGNLFLLWIYVDKCLAFMYKWVCP